MGRKYKVYCCGCAFLFYVKHMPPSCLFSADFVSGPLRPCIDVEGIVSAIVRNRNNDCINRSPVSLRAYQLKKWLLKKLNSSIPEESDVREEHIKEYSCEKERSEHERECEKDIEYYSEDSKEQ